MVRRRRRRCCRRRRRRCRKLITFFSSSPESTKPGTNHPWVKGIQVYSNEEHALFQGEI